MATIKFLLQSKSDNAQIYIRLSLSQYISLKKKTGFIINPKDWSETTNRPKQTTAQNKQLNNFLNKLETFIFDHLNNDLANGVIVDSFWLESKINECFNRVEKVDNGLIINHIQFIIDNAKTRKIKGKNKLGLSESRVKGYITFKKLIVDYQKSIKKQINFLDINKAFIEKFTNWLINEKKYSINYSGKQIDNIKTVCLDAERLDIPVNPFVKQIEGFTEQSEDRFIVTLSFQELEQIRSTEIQNKALQNAKNWILLGCEIGQRANDLLNITKNDIRYKGGNIFIDIIQQKTKKSVTVGVVAPHVIDIIENDFPRKISTQKLNEYIKDVCKICGITELTEGKKLNIDTKRKELGFYPKHELITTHSFRRSFATNYYKKVPTPILISITGHSKESLFLDYINQREDKDNNAEMFMQFYQTIHKEKQPQLKAV